MTSRSLGHATSTQRGAEEDHMSRRLIAIVHALLIVVFAAPARAQGVASSLQELRLLVRVGETVTIRDAQGAETKGRILNLSPAALQVMVKGEHRTLAEADVSTLLQRRQDSLGNGALWGFGTGVALFGSALAVVGCEGCGVWAIPVGLIYGGLGAGIGVGLDALHTSSKVIYERAPTVARVRFAPVVSGSRRGVALHVTF
jgi:hypothetical protein